MDGAILIWRFCFVNFLNSHDFGCIGLFSIEKKSNKTISMNFIIEILRNLLFEFFNLEKIKCVT